MALVKPLKLVTAGSFSVFGTADYVDAAHLGSGTPTSSMALAGDNSWASISTILGYTPISKAGHTGISGSFEWTSGNPSLSVASGSDTSSFLIAVYGATVAKRAALYIAGDGSTASLVVDNGSIEKQLRMSHANGPQFYDGGATYKIWHENNDGTGAGLDADLLDGYHGSGSATANTYVLRDANGSITVKEAYFGYVGAASAEGGQVYFQKPGSGSTLSGDVIVDVNTNSFRMWDSGGTFKGAYIDLTTCAAGAASKIWHSENDGSGSTLDADLLDAQEGSYYRDASNLNAGTVPTARLGSGTANSAAFLRGDQTWSNALTGALDLSGASSGQIKFPATQNASSDANTLDDYEEGTWTPTASGTGGSAGAASFTTSGNYTKVGNRYFWFADITVTNIGSWTGNLQFTLPATSGADSCGAGRDVAVNNKMASCQNPSGSNLIDVILYDGTSGLVNGYRFRVSGHFRL